MTVTFKLTMWDGKTPDLPVEISFEGKDAEKLATQYYWTLMTNMSRGHLIRVDSEKPDEVATIDSFDHPYDAFLERKSRGHDDEYRGDDWEDDTDDFDDDPIEEETEAT